MKSDQQNLPQTPGLGGWLDTIQPRLSEPLSARQQEQLLAYARLLRTWNEQVNLTAIVDDEGIAVRHFQDSLTVVPVIRREQASGPAAASKHLVLADVGTGAGFPGLVLKIACPEVDVILVDALAKRLKFLETVIADLGLSGIRTLHARAEDAGRLDDLREKCDIVVARAVASLPVLSEYCLPLVRKEGLFIAMKAQAEEELYESAGAIRTLGGETPGVDRFTLKGTDMTRTIITVRKARPTPPAYPRKAGKVEQNPLK